MASPQPEEPVVSEQHEQQDDPMQGTAPAQPEEGEGEVEDAPMSDDRSEEPEEDEEEARRIREGFIVDEDEEDEEEDDEEERRRRRKRRKRRHRRGTIPRASSTKGHS